MAHTDPHTAHAEGIPEIIPEIKMVNRDEEHLKLLGLYHFVVAGFNLLALILFVIVPLLMGPAYMQSLTGTLPPGGAAAVQQQLIGGLIVGGLLTFILAMNGWSLRRHENWMSCIIMSCIQCLSIPLGMILGISAILVLRRPSVKELFRQTKLQRTQSK